MYWSTHVRTPELHRYSYRMERQVGRTRQDEAAILRRHALAPHTSAAPRRQSHTVAAPCMLGIHWPRDETACAYLGPSALRATARREIRRLSGHNMPVNHPFLKCCRVCKAATAETPPRSCIRRPVALLARMPTRREGRHGRKPRHGGRDGALHNMINKTMTQAADQV